MDPDQLTLSYMFLKRGYRILRKEILSLFGLTINQDSVDFLIVPSPVLTWPELTVQSFLQAEIITATVEQLEDISSTV